MEKLYVKSTLPILYDEELMRFFLNIEKIRNCRTCTYSRKSLSEALTASWQCNHPHIKQGTQKKYVIPEQRIDCECYQKEKLNENIKIYKK
jgi:hypothetical protein